MIMLGSEKLKCDVESYSPRAGLRINTIVHAKRGTAGGYFRVETMILGEREQVLGADIEAQALHHELHGKALREGVSQGDVLQAEI